jgi:hypothetical protein
MSIPVLKANLSPTQCVTEDLSMTVLRPGREAALIKNTGDYSSLPDCLPQFCRRVYAMVRHSQQGELYMSGKSAMC